MVSNVPNAEQRVEKLEELKFNIRENDVPNFTDDELVKYLERHKWDVDRASYDCLIVKAENTGLNVSGLTTRDSSSYFKMLAAKYRKNNSGILRGV